MPAALPRATLLALLALFTLAWFVNLDGRRLQHPDEGRYAEIGREMAFTGDWVTPRLNDLKYFEKPPLQYWLTAAGFKAFGVREGVARLVPATAGFVALFAIGYAGWKLGGPTLGVYAWLVLAGTFWWFGLAHFVTLDAVLASALAVALAAFLVAQRTGASARARLAFMLVAWAAATAALLTKGLVALAIPAGALVLYTLTTRDVGPWKRLHLGPGLALGTALAAPWFVIVSARNPEFARFFFIHEHVERFLTTEHNRPGAWWYFVPVLAAGLLPWLGVFVWTAIASWRQAAPDAQGFSWQRFCFAWAAFVFLFFSASGSKLPSYILPMFPALALPIAWQLERLSTRTLFRLSLPLVLITATLLAGTVFGFDAVVNRLADAITPATLYRNAEPWVVAAFAVGTAGGIVALVLGRRDTPAARLATIATVSLTSIVGLQCAFAASDAFNPTRSGAALVAQLRADADPPFNLAAPVFQVGVYDQTLPFYLGHPTTVVAYRDELALGIDAEPGKAIATLAEWEARWRALPQGYAVLQVETLLELQKAGVPFRVNAHDARRVMIARR